MMKHEILMADLLVAGLPVLGAAEVKAEHAVDRPASFHPYGSVLARIDWSTPPTDQQKIDVQAILDAHDPSALSPNEILRAKIKGKTAAESEVQDFLSGLVL